MTGLFNLKQHPTVSSFQNSGHIV